MSGRNTFKTWNVWRENYTKLYKMKVKWYEKGDKIWGKNYTKLKNKMTSLEIKMKWQTYQKKNVEKTKMYEKRKLCKIEKWK